VSTQLIVLIGGVLVLAVGIAIAVAVLEKKVNADRETVWREVAARRGGVYRPGVYGSGGWTTPQVIDVMANGARVYVDTYHIGQAENTEPFTQLRAEYLTGGGPSFEVSVPTLAVVGPRVALGGNPAFDEGFVIRTDAAAAVAAVWTPAAKDRMLRHFRNQRTKVRCDGRTITMTWLGDERMAERLDAAIDIMGDLALAGRGGR
jgi:hypothetical protein